MCELVCWFNYFCILQLLHHSKEIAQQTTNSSNLIHAFFRFKFISLSFFQLWLLFWPFETMLTLQTVSVLCCSFYFICLMAVCIVNFLFGLVDYSSGLRKFSTVFMLHFLCSNRANNFCSSSFSCVQNNRIRLSLRPTEFELQHPSRTVTCITHFDRPHQA